MKKIIGFKFLRIQIILCYTAMSLHALSDSAVKAKILLGIEQSLCNALPGDSVTWNQYLDSGWYATTEHGTGTYKKEFIAGFAPFAKGFSGNILVTHPVCLFHDATAVVHYIADEHETVYGQNLHTTYAIVDTWYRTPASWKMLSMQIFEIAQLPKPVRSDSSALKMYTGIYELAEGKTARVSFVRDMLFIQKNDRAPVALYQETNNVFFVLSDTRGRKIFVKGGSGKMMMLERRNGQDLIWKWKSNPF